VKQHQEMLEIYPLARLEDSAMGRLRDAAPPAAATPPTVFSRLETGSVRARIGALAIIYRATFAAGTTYSKRSFE